MTTASSQPVTVTSKRGTDPMLRRIVSCLPLTLFLLIVPFAHAQQPTGKVPRIGFLTTASASDPQTTLRLDAFRQGLRDLGYVEGENINIDYRYADGKPERLP